MNTKKTMRKIVMAAGVVSMSIGLITSLSVDARSVVTGGGEKGPAVLTDCPGWGTGDYIICSNVNDISCTHTHHCN